MKEAHGKTPCIKDSNNSINEFANNILVKKCPKCSIITEKKEGCNHITCTKCNYQWCWLYNGEYEPNHFDKGKCKGLTFFNPKNENEIKKALEDNLFSQRSNERAIDVRHIDYNNRLVRRNENNYRCGITCRRFFLILLLFFIYVLFGLLIFIFLCNNDIKRINGFTFCLYIFCLFFSFLSFFPFYILINIILLPIHCSIKSDIYMFFKDKIL